MLEKVETTFFYEPKSRRSLCESFHFSCALFTLTELLLLFLTLFILCHITETGKIRPE